MRYLFYPMYSNNEVRRYSAQINQSKSRPPGSIIIQMGVVTNVCQRRCKWGHTLPAILHAAEWVGGPPDHLIHVNSMDDADRHISLRSSYKDTHYGVFATCAQVCRRMGSACDVRCHLFISDWHMLCIFSSNANRSAYDITTVCIRLCRRVWM